MHIIMLYLRFLFCDLVVVESQYIMLNSLSHPPSLSLSFCNNLKHSLVCMRVSYKGSANMSSYYMAHKKASYIVQKFVRLVTDSLSPQTRAAGVLP